MSEGGRLRTDVTHDFIRGNATSDYTVAFALTDGAPVAPANDYRRWLIEHDRLSSLDQKIRENPEVGKLIGAFHAYLWGDGRSTGAIKQLQDLGIGKMWLGYDADGSPMSPRSHRGGQRGRIPRRPLQQLGQRPRSRHCRHSRRTVARPVWPQACVHDENCEPETGFGGRAACYLSSQALADAEPQHHYLASRIDSMTANGGHSYFLDVDATGEVFRDHSPGHPMTQAQDRANRLARMRELPEGLDLVLGSETVGSWANQMLAFSHGSTTPVSPGLWKAKQDKETWGRLLSGRKARGVLQAGRTPLCALTSCSAQATGCSLS
ncbi:glycoside hydrolase [Saccharopolyspora sp. NPDC050389]|uniref:glycoside hydrolase n=1 Tax=Saccharopolyspora sp. NPDC050389 TaxID=3155516 RepID=UPI0033C51F5B